MKPASMFEFKGSKLAVEKPIPFRYSRVRICGHNGSAKPYEGTFETMLNHKKLNKESGKSELLILGAMVLLAAGALAYFYGKALNKDGGDASEIASSVAQDGSEQTADAAAGPVIKDPRGNPVVAKIKGTDITRNEVFGFIQGLPPQARQQPLEKLYPLALEQVINNKIIADRTKGVNLDGDAEVRKQLAQAKDQIVRAVYIENKVKEQITEDRLKGLYDGYVKTFPEIEDVKARHILVKEESKAKELIQQLEGGASFEELAKANSTDGTAQNGGDLGYFAKTDMVPAFGEAAFALEIGSYSKKPVKTEFGYHVIKSEEKRKRPPAAFEDIKPFLEAQLRQQILGETLERWRKEAEIKRFDINGDAVIEPASGEEANKAAAPAPAPATPPAQ